MTEYHTMIVKPYDTKAEALADTSFDEYAKTEAALTFEQGCKKKNLTVASETIIANLGVVSAAEFSYDVDITGVDYSVYPDHTYLRRARASVWLKPAVEVAV